MKPAQFDYRFADEAWRPLSKRWSASNGEGRSSGVRACLARA